MGPVPALMGIVPPQSHFSFSWQACGPLGFSRKRRALPLKARERSVRPTMGRVSHPLPAGQPIDSKGNRKEGMFCCFTHEGVCTQVTTQVTLMGLIWLRHTRARMGHQVVASPTVRYILHGGRNRSVAVNSLSLIEIWETCTLLLKHTPTSRARTPLALGRGSKGGRPGRLCHLVGGSAATLRGSKLAKWQLSMRQRLNHSKVTWIGKAGRPQTSDESPTHPIGRCAIIVESCLLPPTARGPAPPLPARPVAPAGRPWP